VNREQFMKYVSREDITEDDLPQWFATVRQFLQDAYVAAATPWTQSGKSGTYENWVRLRLPLSEMITDDGSYLDIGCANGFLLECLLGWTQAKGVTVTPWGLDIGDKLVELARQRLPDYANNIYCANSWDWQPPQRFDYVQTGLEYVPLPFRQAYINRLFERCVADDGKLIIAHYRSTSEDLTADWVDELLAEWDYPVEKITRGFNGDGIEQTRYVHIHPAR
jgi:2-polyprenyl-3-methyl-5-hydroxy-6-metoxy-1,4-benzoquinol methylase